MTPLSSAAGRAHSTPNTCHDTVKHPIITLLAGDHGYLAYALGYRIDLARGGREAGDGCHLPRFDSTSEYLYVRSRAGKTRSLGRAPAWLAGDKAVLVGSMLYDDTVNDNDLSYRSVVHWWDLRRHTSGHYRVPAGFDFATAGPDGAVLQRGGTLIERTRTGRRIALGRPFGNHRFGGAVANHHGLAALGGGRARYMTFDHPRDYRAIDVTGPAMQCPTLSRVALGCYNVADDDSGLTSDQNEIVPLRGGAPTVDPTGGGLPGALANGSTLVYLANDGIRSFSRAHPHAVLGSKSLGESQDAGVDESGDDPYQDLHREWVPVISAVGGAVLVNASRTRVVLAHDARHTTLLFRVPTHDH
jgi:hypothetical protein